ncbi:MAG: UDP-galactopyranose mutase [Candidatus Kapabacteria bacterium]|nr:UDP-galactopyranose mutase [Candidatus Kapabacteria bacterium]
MKYDFLIVGAGLAGSVCAERIATLLNKKVLIIDKRDHIGGNCYDFMDDNGIVVHKYGPHIFHTNSKIVWDYLSNFTEWHIYFHKVLALVEDSFVPVPFNFNSIVRLFPKKFAQKIISKLLQNYNYGTKIPILDFLETEDKDLKFLAEYVYKNVFYGYNIKQWGKKPEDLDHSVSARVPVFLSRDDRYFQDYYQAIPSLGYTAMIEKILNNKNIDLRLNCSFKDLADNSFDKLIYTGPIDEYFDYSFGALPYRTINFDIQNIEKVQFQKVAQVNYPNNFDFTRITEFKHFLDNKSDRTTVAFEYSAEHQIGINEPYYPVPMESSNLTLKLYNQEAEKLKNTFFIGRLAEYKYYNMDQIIRSALGFIEKLIND